MIFGMPAEAIKTGAVDEVLPLDEISAAIEKRVMQNLAAGAGRCAMKIATHRCGQTAARAGQRSGNSILHREPNFRDCGGRGAGNSQHGQPGRRGD